MNIHCVYNNKGCEEVVKLNKVMRISYSNSLYKPIQGCNVISSGLYKPKLFSSKVYNLGLYNLELFTIKMYNVNIKAEMPSSRELTVMLANMEKKITCMETNIVSMEMEMGKHEMDIKTDRVTVETKIDNLKRISRVWRQAKRISQMDGKLETVNNKV